MSTVTQIEQAIQHLFGAAERLAKDTGFVKRMRANKFSGKSFAATLIFGLTQRGEVSWRSLAPFARHLGVKVSAQAIDERLGKQAALFLQALLNVAFTLVVSLSPRHIFQDRKRASGSKSGTTNREPPSIFGPMQRQATGQMSGSDSSGLFLCLREQKAQIQSAQAKKSLVAPICPVEVMTMAVFHTR
jgi:hypothetical protein